MDVQFSAEQEAQLSLMARHQGTDAMHLVKSAALRLLSDEESFNSAVREGVASADSGQFVEHAHVWATVQEILNGK